MKLLFVVWVFIFFDVFSLDKFKPEESLIFVTKTGDYNRVKTLLQKRKIKKMINAQDFNGESSLSIALGQSREDIALLLVSKGANIKFERGGELRDKQPMLNLATQKGCNTFVKILLYKGVSIESEDFCGKTSLHEAVDSGNVELTSFLLDKGANIEAKTNYEATPLFLAIVKNNKQMIELLLSRGADLSYKNSDGNNYLHIASRVGSVDAVELLLDKGFNLEGKNFKGETPFFSAVVGSYVHMVSYLIKKGVSIKVQNDAGMTPLHAVCMDYSVVKNKEAVVDILLDNGLDINAKDANDITSLKLAIILGNVNLAKLLISKGASFYDFRLLY